jgi:hypothetical protein
MQKTNLLIEPDTVTRYAFQPLPRSVIRGGFGMFYGGLQSQGNTNLGTNFPWSNDVYLYAPNCALGSCPSLSSEGITSKTA